VDRNAAGASAASGRGDGGQGLFEQAGRFERLAQHREFDARRVGKHERFVDDGHEREARRIAGEFQRHSGAERSGVQDRLRVRIEHRPRPFERVGRSADHREQRPLRGPWLATADARVEHGHAVRLGGRREVADRVERDRGVHADDRAGCEGAEQTVWTGEHRARLVGIEHDDAHDIGLACRVGG
jgi:hypothetical protein